MPRPLAAIEEEGFIFIPRGSLVNYAVKVTRTNGTVDDITEDLLSGKVEDGATDIIGNFEFSVDNSAKTYSGVWAIGNTVMVYMDYSDASTRRFRGKIEKINTRNVEISISGRSNAADLLGITVTKTYVATSANSIISDLLSSYTTGFTTTNLNTSTTNLTITFQNMPLWDAIVSVAKAAGFDVYIDDDLDINFFKIGSKDSTEALSELNNIDSVEDFADDVSEVRNRIIVYGQPMDGNPLMYTAEDVASQDLYGIREEIIRDTNLTTYAQVQEMGDAILADKKDPVELSEIICSILLAEISPGDRIIIAAPGHDFTLGYYRVVSFMHDFIDMSTTLRISKEPPSIVDVVAGRIYSEQKTLISENPNELRHSYAFPFNDDTLTSSHSNTLVSNGVLKAGIAVPATWISTSRIHTANITKAEVRAAGTALENVEWYVSVDNGVSYKQVTLSTLTTSLGSGNQLRLKVVISSLTTEIESVTILYA